MVRVERKFNMDIPSQKLYLKVLTIAANEELPSYIGDNKIAPDHIFLELLNAGHLTGKHEKFMGGGGYFMNLAITTYGRQYLQQLISEKENKTIKNKAKNTIKKFLNWTLLSIGAIIVALITAWLIKKFIG